MGPFPFHVRKICETILSAEKRDRQHYFASVTSAALLSLQKSVTDDNLTKWTPSRCCSDFISGIYGEDVG